MLNREENMSFLGRSMHWNKSGPGSGLEEVTVPRIVVIPEVSSRTCLCITWVDANIQNSRSGS